MAGLRVIGGIAKGKRLKTRKVKHLRPATDYLREALFNILMNLVAMMKNRLRKNPFRMLGGILVRPALKEIFSDFDYTEIGGAPLLGVQGISIICHGSSHARAIRSAIRTASRAVKGDLVGRISKALNLEDNTQ